MKQKKIWILAPLILVVLALAAYRIFLSDDQENARVVEVEKGKFELYVVSMGELVAHKSTDILIPDELLDRTVRIRHISINDMVREGTEVEKGDYVATLDPSEVEENMKRTQEDLDLRNSDLERARMDSSLILSDARDAIRQGNDNLLDKEIRVDQSKYESKAVQRQAQIELEMAKRSIEQKKRNYLQQKRKMELSIRRIEDKIREEEKHMQVLIQLKADLRVKAPSRGIVVYARDYRGNKIKVGSQVSRWNPRIAILPDLSTILSETYVKEIDVTEIREGMPVKISIDAYPGEEFKGVVKNIANIGQKITGQFLNGFKVEVEVDPEGFDLLPGMTATNRFIIQSIDDQLVIPREAIFVEDNQKIVYKKTPLGIVRQPVTTAGENDENVRIIDGVGEGDKVLLDPPQ